MAKKVTKRTTKKEDGDRKAVRQIENDSEVQQEECPHG
jgi:hypothetical protein